MKAILLLAICIAIGYGGYYYLNEKDEIQSTVICKEITLKKSSKGRSIKKTYEVIIEYSATDSRIAAKKARAEEKAKELIKWKAKMDRICLTVSPNQFIAETQTLYEDENYKQKIQQLEDEYFNFITEAYNAVRAYGSDMGLNDPNKKLMMKARSILSKSRAKKIYIPRNIFQKLDTYMDKLTDLPDIHEPFKKYRKSSANQHRFESINVLDRKKLATAFDAYLEWYDEHYLDSKHWDSYFD